MHPRMLRQLLLALVVLLPGVPALHAQRPPAATARLDVTERSIADLQAALRSGRLTCRALVEAYLARIEALDRAGPALTALTVVNDRARQEADSLDRWRRSGGAAGPLHCVPLIIKDNFETRTLPTTAGSLALEGYVAGRDAFQVARVRAAGALVLAKASMAEFAFSPYETVNSIVAGYTKNPYVLDRSTAGSSGGTAAAVAASLGAAGLGTDTGNSIRGPSAHQALVGIRSTLGLTSRGGVVPLNLAYDVAGPMARTVADAVALFQVVVGEDPADPLTAAARGRTVPTYADSLRTDGLRGARIGVLLPAWDRPTTDPEVRAVFAAAVADLRRLGATVLDSVPLPGLAALQARDTADCNRTRHDLEQWLAGTDGRAPVATIDAILASRRYHPSIDARLRYAQRATLAPESNPACAADEAIRAELRTMLGEAMDRLALDAVVYPTWSNPPRRIGDLNTPPGDNSQYFSPMTGWPAVQVPMGWTRGGRLPAGLTLLGRAWSEGTLLRLAYAYEQGTRHRRAPAFLATIGR